MTCNHEKINYTRRVFLNRTHHLCRQCADCGMIVKDNNKLWLKPDDIPPGENILEFNEKLYLGEDDGQHRQARFI